MHQRVGVNYFGSAGEESGIAATPRSAVGKKKKKRTHAFPGTLQTVTDCVCDLVWQRGEAAGANLIEPELDCLPIRIEAD